MTAQSTLIQKGLRGGKVLGFALIALGVLAILSPMYAGMAVTTLVAVCMIVAGAIRLFISLKAGWTGKGFITVFLGAVLVVAGVLMLAQPVIGLASLTFLLAVFFLIDGVAEMVGAFRHRPEPGWIWLFFGGLVSFLLGWFVWKQWPLSGAWAIGTLIGLKLLFTGITVLAVSAAASKVAGRIRAAAEEARSHAGPERLT